MFRINKVSSQIFNENNKSRFKKNNLIENLNNKSVKKIKEDKELTIKQLQSKQRNDEFVYLKKLNGEADRYEIGPLSQRIEFATKQNYQIISVIDQINERSLSNQTQNAQQVLPLMECIFGVLLTQFMLNQQALVDVKTIDGRDLINLDRLRYDKALQLGAINSIERVTYQQLGSSKFASTLINNFIDSLNVPVSQLFTVFSRNHPLNIAHITINSLLIFGTLNVAQFDMVDKLKKDRQFSVNSNQNDILLKTYIDIKLHTYDTFIKSFSFTNSDEPKFKQNEEIKWDQTTNEEILAKPDIAKLQPELQKLVLIGIFSSLTRNFVGQQVSHTFSFRNQDTLQFLNIFYLGSLLGVVFIGLIFILMLQGSIQSNVNKFTDSFNVHLQGMWSNDLHHMRLSQMTYISIICEIMTKYLQTKLLKKSLQMSELSKIPVYAINIFVSMNKDLQNEKATSLNIVNIIGSAFILTAVGFNQVHQLSAYKKQNLDQNSNQQMYNHKQFRETDLLQYIPYFKIDKIKSKAIEN